MVEYKAFASQKENTNYNHIYMKKKKQMPIVAYQFPQDLWSYDLDFSNDKRRRIIWKNKITWWLHGYRVCNTQVSLWKVFFNSQNSGSSASDGYLGFPFPQHEFYTRGQAMIRYSNPCLVMIRYHNLWLDRSHEKCQRIKCHQVFQHGKFRIGHFQFYPYGLNIE